MYPIPPFRPMSPPVYMTPPPELQEQPDLMGEIETQFIRCEKFGTLIRMEIRQGGIEGVKLNSFREFYFAFSVLTGLTGSLPAMSEHQKAVDMARHWLKVATAENAGLGLTRWEYYKKALIRAGLIAVGGQ